MVDSWLRCASFAHLGVVRGDQDCACCWHHIVISLPGSAREYGLHSCYRVLGGTGRGSDTVAWVPASNGGIVQIEGQRHGVLTPASFSSPGCRQPHNPTAVVESFPALSQLTKHNCQLMR
eukprot:321096-Amphidinium_carterae.2